MNERYSGLDFEEIDTAEDFLEHFGIEYDPAVVQVNRLHILQRFHDYLDQVEVMPKEHHALHQLYGDLLKGAYDDFVKSDACTEKVFRVFHLHEPVSVEIPLGELTGHAT